ncbi:MAG: hypothetical protein OXC94_07960 [Chloroflexi bacterium]|nr:hypothetical protein [Chloroflexota bacterium]
MLVGAAGVLLYQQWALAAFRPSEERRYRRLRRRAAVAAMRPFGDADWRPARPSRQAPPARRHAA